MTKIGRRPSQRAFPAWFAAIGLISLISLYAQTAATKTFKILILGDSLTEGYGVEKDDAFPARLETLIKAWRPGFQVLNGGSSGSTSAGGVRRLQWYAKSNPDLVILALGSNDGLRGVQPSDTRKNVEAALLYCRQKHWRVAVVGLQVPPNYGAKFSADFARIFPELAAQYQIPFLPFLLAGVAGEPTLNQADGIHPNEKGHLVVAETLFRFLKPMLADSTAHP